jgi:hypothetical protein
MYYILKCPIPITANGENLMDIKNHFDAGSVWSWTDGLPLDADEDPGELPINIDVDYFQNYQGAPREFYALGVSILSPRVKAVFDSLGIDNILYYPAVLHISPLGRKVDYFVFKIIGRVAAADATSQLESYQGRQAIGDASVHHLKIDATKTFNFLIFRLAESTTTIVVHEKVKLACEAAGIDTLQFLLPEEHMQL